MDEKRSNQKLWIIIVVVLGLLFVCAVGMVAGGLAGYIAGRRAAYRYEYSPRILPVTPQPRTVPVPRGPEELPEVPSMVGGGALVTDVVNGGPAERADLRRGDIIVEINGQPLSEGENVAEMIQKYKPGDKVELRVIRDGRSQVFTVKLGRNPNKSGNTPWLGLYYRSVPWVEFGVPDSGD
jgi:membrane-associated protease RseP (regulator of RpoE activity)